MNAARPFVPRPGHQGQARPRFPQSRRQQLKVWWRESDRVLLGLVLALMVLGTIAVAAASPASARRLSTAAERLDELHFFWLHLRWQALGLVTLVITSMLPRDVVRRGAILLAAGMTFFLLLIPLVGDEVNGAKRWIDVGIRFQPSEFLKPAFALAIAWILSWRARDPDLPVIHISGAVLFVVVMLLMLQPNLGDAILFFGCWAVLVFLAGLPMQRVCMAGGLGVVLLTLAYFLYDNARHRIDSFLGGGTAYDQVDLASRTLMGGGWTGTGLWLGQRKMSLPEAHTDYIFSVIGEEFGLLVCAVVVLLYLAIVLRVLSRLAEEENLFTILAGSGLIALFGGQAFINILVNLQLFPSKGMTLPLVSYGGSSTVALCFTVGLLVAVTRRNPFLPRDKFSLMQVLEKGAVR